MKNRTLNKNIALYLIPLLEAAGSTFSYGKKWRPVRMRKSKIMLPIDEKSNPDWDFMENEAKARLLEKEDNLTDVLERKIYDLLESNITCIDSNVHFDVFNISDIFPKIKRGKRLKKDDHISGSIPYISSTGLNNGVDGFIGNTEDVRVFSNNITIANSGSVGSSFFHPYKFIASDHVTALTLPENISDKYVYLYLVTILKRLGNKYSFNREINNKRINKEKIILPINDLGEPNWEYMSNYMKNTELENLRKLLYYFENK